MRFNKYAAPMAILMAVCLTTPFTAQAAPKTEFVASMPNLVVEATTHASESNIVIRNDGGMASAPCHAKVTFSTGEQYYLPVLDLQPNCFMTLSPPRARDGKPFTISIEVDCDSEVDESNEADNQLTARYLN